MTALATPMSTSSLIAIAALQILVQIVVFAFVISFKAEFWRWAKSYKAAKKITDFDYDFSDEKTE
jgi:threonine/homoserine/homoserine lactone efflux protein